MFQSGGDIHALLDILHVGKAIIQEVSRYNFAVDIGIVETLRSRCMYFTSALVIASRELEKGQQIMDDVLLAIIEFQKSFPISKNASATLKKTNCILFVQQMLEMEVEADQNW